MTITAALPGTLPARTQTPEEFVPAMDAFIAALPELASQMDIAVSALNFNSITDTSSTSNVVDTLGDKTFTVSLNKSFYPGMWLTIADSAAPTTNSMTGQVKSYTSTTLVFTNLSFRGSGTKTSWVIVIAAAVPSLIASQHVLHIHTGNGHGSSSTMKRRFSTTVTNTGQSVAWTYADSATLGAKVTFILPGLYNISYSELATKQFGLSKNQASAGTTVFDSLTAAEKLLRIGGSAGVEAGASITTYMSTGDTIEFVTNGSVWTTNADAFTAARIERLI